MEREEATTEETKETTRIKATINVDEEEVDETPTKRRRNMPVSIVWQHFERLKDTIMDVDVKDEVETDVDLDYGITNSFKDVETTTLDKESEIDVYLLESLAPADSYFDILHWWKQNEHRFEVLSRISRDILAIPVSTVSSESTFNIGGCVVNSNRCSVAPKMMEALICTHNWLNTNPINLEIHNQDLEEDLRFEEGFRAVMDGEKDVEDMEDFV